MRAMWLDGAAHPCSRLDVARWQLKLTLQVRSILRREPINSEWSADVGFGAYSGLKSDVTALPKTCTQADIGNNTPRYYC
jgi:hypothetical protein